jgi:hypothetical protein
MLKLNTKVVLPLDVDSMKNIIAELIFYQNCLQKKKNTELAMFAVNNNLNNNSARFNSALF